MNSSVPISILISGALLLISGTSIILDASGYIEWTKKPSDRTEEKQKKINRFGFVLGGVFVSFGIFFLIVYFLGG